MSKKLGLRIVPLAIVIFSAPWGFAQDAPPAAQPAAAPPPAAVKYEELAVSPTLEQDTGDAVRDKDNAALLKFLRATVGQTLSEQPGFGLGQQSKFQYPQSKDKSAKPKELTQTNEKFLSVYFENFYFPMMTKTDPINLGKLARLRTDIQKFARTARGAPRTFLVQKIMLPNLDKIARGNYHPAARYNAVLIIGSLNEEEPASQGNVRKPPRPLDAALPILLTALEDPKATDAVTVAALIGVFRHADLDRELRDAGMPGAYAIPEDVRTRIFEVAHKIASDKTVRPSRSPEGQAWIRRRALEVCASVAVADNRKAIGTALEIVANPKDNTPDSLRCTAAVTLSRFAFPEGYDVKPVEVSQQLGNLAVALCDTELKRLAKLRKEEDRKKMQTPGAAGGMGGGMSAMGAGSASAGSGMPAGMSPMGPGGGSAPGGMSPMGPGGGGASGGIGGMGGMGGGMGGMGGAGGMFGSGSKVVENPYRIDVSRRRLKYELNCVLSGVNRMEKLASQEAEKTQIAGIATALKQLMDVAEIGRREDHAEKSAKGESGKASKSEEDEGPVDLARLSKEIGKKLALLRSALPKAPAEDPLDVVPAAATAKAAT